MAVTHCSNDPVEVGELGGFGLANIGALGAGHAEMDRPLEHGMRPLRASAAVGDVMGEALLPAFEIDGGHALPGFHQRDGNMHRGPWARRYHGPRTAVDGD